MTIGNAIIEGFVKTTPNIVGSITRRSLQGFGLNNITNAFTLENQIQFTTPQVTEQFTKTLLRFGYISDFSVLFGTDKQEKEEYIYGLVVLAAFSLGFYTLWLLVIIILYFLGPKRVGFLSGQPFQRKYYYVNSGQNVNYNNDPAGSTNPYEVNTIQEGAFYDENSKQQKMMNSSGDNRSDDDDDVYIEGDSYDNGNNTQSTKEQQQQQQQQQQHYFSTPPPPLLPESSIPPMGTSYQLTKTDGDVFCCKVEQQKWIRGIYVVSGLILITFAILSVTQGLTNLQESVDTLNYSARQIENTTTQGDAIITNLLTVQSQTAALRTSLQADLQLDNFCPGVANFGANTAVSGITTTLDTVLTGFGQLTDYIDGSLLKSLQSSLQSTGRSAADAANTTQSIDFTSWPTLVILIPFTIIPAILVIKTIMAGYSTSNPTLNCIVVWIIHPLFVIMVLLSAAGFSVAVSVASANSDFCYPKQYSTNPTSVVATNPTKTTDNTTILINSPDVSVLQIVQNGGYDFNSNEYKIISFYVLQCLEAFPYADVVNYLPTLDLLAKSLDETSSQLENTDTVNVLGALCNRDFTPLVQDMREMEKLLSQGYGAIEDTMSLIQCSNIVPIYQNTFYSATCDYSILAVTWFFASAIIITTFGFVMLMFRSSLLDTRYTYTYDSNYGRSLNEPTSFHDEHDDNNNNNNNNNNKYDEETRAGYTTSGNDTVMNSVVNYEKSELSTSNEF